MKLSTQQSPIHWAGLSLFQTTCWTVEFYSDKPTDKRVFIKASGAHVMTAAIKKWYSTLSDLNISLDETCEYAVTY
jgi:hypothetical protein